MYFPKFSACLISDPVILIVRFKIQGNLIYFLNNIWQKTCQHRLYKHFQLKGKLSQ